MANASQPSISNPVRLQLSTPELGATCDLPQTPALMQTHTQYKVPYSRSFTEKTAPEILRPGSTVDTRHVHIYLRRRSSRTSVYSTASAGLVNSDNASLASTSAPHSRPVSAENNPSVVHKPVTPGHHQVNTRIVLPSPSGNRLFPNSQVPLTRSASIPTLRRRPSYLDKLVCQILDYLFMGGMEAAYNANLLCRLNIEYVIDISNVEPSKVPRSKRSDCPCLCPLETAHSRARMAIMIDEHSQVDLVPYFDDVNRFIESARACGKHVLVHSDNGKNRCVLFVVQYLMKSMNFDTEKAINFVKARKTDIGIGENFQKSLRKWEAILQHRSRDAGVPKIGRSTGLKPTNVGTHQIGASAPNFGEYAVKKRAAWM